MTTRQQKALDPVAVDKRFKFFQIGKWNQEYYTCLTCMDVFKADGIRKHWNQKHGKLSTGVSKQVCKHCGKPVD